MFHQISASSTEEQPLKIATSAQIILLPEEPEGPTQEADVSPASKADPTPSSELTKLQSVSILVAPTQFDELNLKQVSFSQFALIVIVAPLLT